MSMTIALNANQLGHLADTVPRPTARASAKTNNHDPDDAGAGAAPVPETTSIAVVPGAIRVLQRVRDVWNPTAFETDFK